MHMRGMKTHFEAVRRGFTIIELLVVIMIIGLLTGLAANSYVSAQQNARDNARKTNVNSISAAVESYYRVFQDFPGVSGGETGFSSNWNSVYAQANGCMTYWSAKQSVAYYYYPTSTAPGTPKYALPCGSSSRTKVTDGGSQTFFDPALYQPANSWIPGLGAYLNPIPVENRYASYAAVTGDATLPLDAPAGTFTCDNDFLVVNGRPTFTYEYRKLSNGYMVYTNLESPTYKGSQSTVIYSASTDPVYPAGGSDGTCSPATNEVRQARTLAGIQNNSYLLVK
jgi:prepilin-type N-terminal cleavage/methylation domain-containing protein